MTSTSYFHELGPNGCWCGGRGLCAGCDVPAPVPAAAAPPTLTGFLNQALADCVNAGPEPTAPECETCQGAGEIEEACGRDEFGVYETDVWPCPDCDGTGDARVP